MPITSSATKALRQSKRRAVRNLRKAKSYKDTVKEFKRLITAKKFDEAKALLPKVYKKLDKASKGQIIAKNKASRLKAAAAKMLSPKTA